MAIVEVSVVPIGTKKTSLSRYVAGCMKVLGESGLPYQLNSMGTVIEGDLAEVLDVVRRMHEAPFAAGVTRVTTLIKIDERRDGAGHSMAAKIRSVEEKLQKV